MGAVIGYFTNWLAIKMLFRPHMEKRFFGVRVPFTPGLIPKRRHVLARKTAAVISEHLLTDDALKSYFLSVEVCKMIEDTLDGFFNTLKISEKTVGGIFGDGGLPEIIRKTAFESFSEKMRSALNDCVPKAHGLFIRITESDFFTENIKPVVIGLIRQNTKGIAALFVDPEKIYGDFLRRASEYLDNPENGGEILERLTLLSGVLPSLAKEIPELLIIDETPVMSTKIGALLTMADEKTNGKIYDTLKSLIMDKYKNFIQNDFEGAFAFFDVSGIIEAQIDSFEMDYAEEIIVSVIERELKAITRLGGVLGFIIGLAPLILHAVSMV